MPWYVTLLIQMALKFGFPVLINYLLTVDGIPAEVKEILRKLLLSIQDPTIPNSVARRVAKEDMKALKRRGVGSAPTTV